jgi:hypothetical protein
VGAAFRGIEMSRKHKMNRHRNALTPHQSRKRFTPLAMVIVLAAVVVVGLGLWSWFAPESAFDKLKGKWLRPDGGYVLDIKSVGSDGKVEMTYLNPNLIHVSKAQASMKADKLELFIELRDTGYPGNYYTLTYDAGKDQLVGVYYHLGIGQQFDVIFVRTK